MTGAKQKIIPCLWFDRQAEEAAAFYVRPSGTPASAGPSAPGRSARTPTACRRAPC